MACIRPFSARWCEAVLEVQEKARGKARQPKDPRIANRNFPEPF